MSRSITERIAHAFLYETIALLIARVFTLWVLQRPPLMVGFLSISLSLLALIWNLIFNAIFDYYFPLVKPRTVGIRILQALGFEGGMLAVAIPATVLLLDISPWAALVMDSGLLVFFLVYTYCFNLAWDKLRNYW